MKNNQDPENIVFGTAGREHDKFVYDDAAFLLTMAILDKALFGYDTLTDLRTQEIPTGDNEIVLRFHDSVLDKPILRRCTQCDRRAHAKIRVYRDLPYHSSQRGLHVRNVNPRDPSTAR